VILTQQNVLYFLFDNNFIIDEDDLFKDKIKVFTTDSLNNSFLIKIEGKDGLFVKQSYDRGLERENAFIKDKLFSYDTRLFVEKMILVRKLLPGKDSYKVFNTVNDSFPIDELLNNVFKAIDEIPDLKSKFKKNAKIKKTFCKYIPIQIPKISILNSVQQKLWRSVDDKLLSFLKEENKNWARLNTIIHGDLSQKNIIIDIDPISNKTVSIIDWEFIQFGDPVWDYASLYSDIYFSKNNNQQIKGRILEQILGKFSDDELLKFQKYKSLTHLKKLNQLSKIVLTEIDILREINTVNYDFSKL
jgi:thiamine kinase-like enzyme